MGSLEKTVKRTFGFFTVVLMNKNAQYVIKNNIIKK